MEKKLISDYDRFMAKVVVSEATGCWVWRARRDRDGYAAQQRETAYQRAYQGAARARARAQAAAGK